jgi:hypothetical protein
MKCLKLGSVLLCAPGCCRKLGYHSCPNDDATFFRLGSWVVGVMIYTPFISLNRYFAFTTSWPPSFMGVLY